MIGQGGFGDVYLGEKKETQPTKFFAIKIQKKLKMQEQNMLRYIQTEKDVLSIMNHPFIVKLNYAFQTDKKLFLVMDFCNESNDS